MLGPKHAVSRPRDQIKAGGGDSRSRPATACARRCGKASASARFGVAAEYLASPSQIQTRWRRARSPAKAAASRPRGVRVHRAVLFWVPGISLVSAPPPHTTQHLLDGGPGAARHNLKNANSKASISVEGAESASARRAAWPRPRSCDRRWPRRGGCGLVAVQSLMHAGRTRGNWVLPKRSRHWC